MPRSGAFGRVTIWLTAEEGFTAIWEEAGLVLYASPEAAGAE